MDNKLKSSYDKISKLEGKIGYSFKDKSLLLNSLMHRSYVNENQDMEVSDNEKLEFLGDSVLNLVTTGYIVAKFKDLNEGELSKIKSQIISEAVFSKISSEIGLGNYLFLSKGENLSGGRKRSSILCDVFEAVIGAIYLDSDFYTVSEIALKFLKPMVEKLDKIEGACDYKTRLQELVQRDYKVTPYYNLLETSGPDHNKVFTVNVVVGGREISLGVAKSKKRAEKKAAENALEKLGYL